MANPEGQNSSDDKHGEDSGDTEDIDKEGNLEMLNGGRRLGQQGRKYWCRVN